MANRYQALFHLANIRIVTDIGAARSLLEQDHIQIASKLRDQPMLPRGSTLVLAARHAVCFYPRLHNLEADHCTRL